jgi:predicted AAA+ superfamily ATPase
MFKRPLYGVLKGRLQERRRFIQVLSGPRQCGKTTLARQVADALQFPVHFVSADDVAAHGRVWLEEQWDIARVRAREAQGKGSLLVIDEIHKLAGWADTVKRFWDEDTGAKLSVRVLLLGSAPLLVQKGLTESLTGRFEIHRLTHWPYGEMREAFGWSVDQYVYYGGYPGAADLVNDPRRWKSYIQDALIETSVSRDILLLTRVDKPALLRRLFSLGCQYSGQVLSYQKIVGQLQDAGNTTTLAHYLDLLETAGLLAGLQKYAGQHVRRKGSSPKFQVLNTALISAQLQASFKETKAAPDLWGRRVESAIGAHISNESVVVGLHVYYWREGGKEVDFVVVRGKFVTAIEVKSGVKKESLPGMDAFARHFRPHRKLLVGGDGISIRDFLSSSLEKWIA